MKKKHLKEPAQSVVYEVNLTIAATRKKEFLKWLETHIQDMLAVSGFMRASLLQNQDANKPTAQTDSTSTETSDASDKTPKTEGQEAPFSCTVRYHVDSLESLNTYFDTQADAMRAKGKSKFGEALQASRKVFSIEHEQRSSRLTDTESKTAYYNANDTYCMNCETLLRGSHCHSCGQKYQRRVVPIFDMVSELVSGVFEWDSRFWRTVTPLLTKPGYLTKTYLAGKRKRYIPPIRLYLITSVVFFLAATIQPKSMLKHLDVDKPLFSDSLELSLDELEDEVNDTNSDISRAESNTEKATDSDSKPTDDPAVDPPRDSADEENLQPSRKVASEYCEDILSSENEISSERLRERMYQACKSLTTWRGLRDFSLEMLEKLPLTLIFLLPFMALVHKVLYLFSGRYYVEHLLFYVHNFSFYFVFSTISLGIIALLQWQSIDSGWVSGLTTLYAIYYFLRSMRVVYGQGRIVTFVKWLLAILAFINLAMLALTLTAAFTATQLA